MLNLLKENDILFVSAVISYIIYMMIIPKFVTITIVVVLFFFLIFHFIRQLLKDGIVKIPEYSRYYGAFLFYSPIIMIFARKNILKIMKSNWTQGFLGCIVIFTIIEITHSIVFISVRAIILLAISFQFFTKQKRSIS